MKARSLPVALCASMAMGAALQMTPASAAQADSDCDQSYYEGEIQSDHSDPDNCRQEKRRRHKSRGKSRRKAHKRCYLREAIVDPGYRFRRDNVFPRIQDAIDAVRPGGTVYVRARTGAGAGRSGGLPGDRDHVFLESLLITKPMTLKGTGSTRNQWVKVSSGPDGRCLTIDLSRRDPACRFDRKYENVFIRHMDWAESTVRDLSAAPCLDVQNGVLRMSNSNVTWGGSRPAIAVKRGAAAILNEVSASVTDGDGSAITSTGAELEIVGGTFDSAAMDGAIAIRGGTWSIRSAQITGSDTGLWINLTNDMRGDLSGTRFVANQTGLSVVGATDGGSTGGQFVAHGNVFSGNSVGATFQNANSVSFENNRLSGSSDVALRVGRTSGSFSNNIFRNNHTGIEIGPAAAWQRRGESDRPRIFNNTIRGPMTYAIHILRGGAAVMGDNIIRAPKCRCLWGDIDSRDLFIRRSDCPEREWSRSCRRNRERRIRELREKAQQEGVVIEDGGAGSPVGFGQIDGGQPPEDDSPPPGEDGFPAAGNNDFPPSGDDLPPVDDEPSAEESDDPA